MKFKKSILFFIIMFMVSTITLKEVYAFSEKINYTFIGNYHFVDSNGKYGDFEHFTRASNNDIAYCIEPGVSLSKNTYIGYQNLPLKDMASAVNLNEETLKKISTIAYFGCGYKDHSGDEWIVATQSLIWYETGRNFSFTSKNNRADPWKYVISIPTVISDKMSEINELVEKYMKDPSFENDSVKIGLNNYYTFYDNNNSLSDFIVETCENCDAVIENNKVIVYPKSNIGGKISLVKKKYDWENNYSVYYSAEGQDLLSPGNIEETKKFLYYEVISGFLNLKKYDYDNKTCSPKSGGSLAGSVYKLYKSDGTYVNDLIIDEDCNANISELELGSYYIKESIAGKNYEIDPNKYYFDITIENPNVSLTVYDKMYLGEIKLIKNDSKTRACYSEGDSVLEGAVYGLFKKDGTLIKELEIGADCSFQSGKILLLGDYYIQELKAPKGYKLDNEKYEFSITKENSDTLVTINMYEEAYNTNLSIHKTYLKDLGVIEAEEDAVFEIYLLSKNKLVDTLVTSENGIAKVNLDYGDYLIKQKKGKSGYHLSKDVYFSVNELTKDESNIYLLNEPFSAKLKVKKFDNYGNPILLNGFKFKIFDIDKKKYICQFVNYPNKEEICEFTTNSEGEFITPDVLFPSKYRLEEVDSKYESFIWNSEPIFFEINEQSDFIYEENVGNIILIEFQNSLVTGKININKFGEKFLIFNNHYDYTNIPLSNVKFNLYANEDIYSNRILLYKKDDLVSTLTTNMLGYTFKDNLPLGKYYIKELESNENNVIDNNIYEFELKYKDQYTKEVEVNLNIQNYLPKGRLEFFKYNSFTNKGIESVLISIYNNNNELLYQGFTDKNGYIYIDDLYLGQYFLKETIVPYGFKLEEDKIFFQIDKDKTTYLSMANIPLTGKLEITNNSNTSDNFKVYDEDDNFLIIDIPDTFKNDYNYYFFVILILIIAGIICINEIY